MHEEKLETTNRNKKPEILTLVPKSWPIRKAAKKFGVSKKKKKKNLQKVQKLK